MVSDISSNLLWSQGRVIVGALGVLAVAGYFWFWPFLLLSLGLLVFSFYFFRSPHRTCPEAQFDPSIIISPADGKIVDIISSTENNTTIFSHKISIFLSPLDVHVNWIPAGGIVEKIIYAPGSFIPAFLPKSSMLNEHNDVLILAPNGKLFMVRQIAGLVARRICCWIKEQEHVKQGDKFGMIRFGSRVDVYLPANTTLVVVLGQRVYGGQTVLARWQ
jgi:phosphatidylserine decarboxylase